MLKNSHTKRLSPPARRLRGCFKVTNSVVSRVELEFEVLCERISLQCRAVPSRAGSYKSFSLQSPVLARDATDQGFCLPLGEEQILQPVDMHSLLSRRTPLPLKKRPGSSRISMILAGMPRRESHGPRAERRSSKSSTAASPSTAALAEAVPGCRALGHLPEPFESMKG